MSETSHSLISQAKVSLESIQQRPQVATSPEIAGVKIFESEMEQIHHAFFLMREIRQLLESALRDLSLSN
jgi:hypothetical protein